MRAIISSAVNWPCVEAHTVAKPLASTCGHHHLRLEVALVRGVDLDARSARWPRASPSARAASPRAMTVREQTLLGDARTRLDALGEDVLVQHGGIGRHGGGDVEHGRQRLVVDLDQRQRGFGDVHVDGGDGRHRLADPVHLVARHVDLRHHPHVVADLAHGDASRPPAARENRRR